MNRLMIVAAASAVGLAAALVIAAAPQAQTPEPAARFGADGKMAFPKDYRTWVYLTSGMDMAYVEGGGGQVHAFDNVFVDPASYAAYQQTGHWPDGTTLVLEVRGAEAHASIDKAGRSQAGLLAVEAHVKDSQRFADGGWGFFGFGGGQAPARVLPKAAACYACHEAHGAVDTTFTQFYPTLLPVATAKGTLSAAYLADEKSRPSAK